jgi:methylphosphotriester-DNA--protein-cysteine methyltransferase
MGSFEITRSPFRPSPRSKPSSPRSKPSKRSVAANRGLIERFEKKIQTTIARVWGEGEPTRAED